MTLELQGSRDELKRVMVFGTIERRSTRSQLMRPLPCQLTPAAAVWSGGVAAHTGPTARAVPRKAAQSTRPINPKFLSFPNRVTVCKSTPRREADDERNSRLFLKRRVRPLGKRIRRKRQDTNGPLADLGRPG